MDIWCDYASVCSCKGDCTLRHNALRDVVFRFFMAAGLQPERVYSCRGGQNSRVSASRLLKAAGPRMCGYPAGLEQGQQPFCSDIWLAGFCVARSSGGRSSATTTYEVTRDYLGTANSCQPGGLQFCQWWSRHMVVDGGRQRNRCGNRLPA